MEKYFDKFRSGIIGLNQSFDSFYGKKRILYADWTASGRLYKPIEDVMMDRFYGFVANTHSKETFTGKTMTNAYHEAHNIIKKHCNADDSDVIITCGTGMTGAVNKLQRILGLKIPEQLSHFINLEDDDKPIVFVTHMEHHSNHTSWLVTLADVVNLTPDDDGLVNLDELEKHLELNKSRKLKIGAFTACSNVTGIRTNYYEMAALMHKHGGFCFVDFAASAPYVNIDMHPADERQKLNAVFFSPHKFLGGPGSSGVLIFDSKLYHNKIPDQAGGGTVKWTNPWGQHSFIEDIEAREDGGTPGFLQTIKAALAIKLKEEMGVENILKMDEELLNIAFERLEKVNGLHILAGNMRKRLAILSFYIDNIHFNLVVRILNDLFGIQTRGGCSCAGTYGHYLLNVNLQKSIEITQKIENGCYIDKPGWVRLSLHPTMHAGEVEFICDSINYIANNIDDLTNEYIYLPDEDEFIHKNYKESSNIKDFFNL